MRPKDPAGEAWQREADKRWRTAERRARGRSGARGAPIRYYVAPPLPAFERPAHVSREILGRFLHDRDLNVTHDVAQAVEACDLDAIANATWIHFGHELSTNLPGGAIDCQECMPDA